MTDEELKHNSELIAKMQKEVERLGQRIAEIKQYTQQGVWVSDIDYNKEGG